MYPMTLITVDLQAARPGKSWQKLNRTCRLTARVGISQNLCWWVTRDAFIVNYRVCSGRLRSSKVVDFGTNRKNVCIFLLLNSSNVGTILHKFFLLKTATLRSYPIPAEIRWYCQVRPSGWFRVILTAGHLQATLSKLLTTVCVLSLLCSAGWEMSSS